MDNDDDTTDFRAKDDDDDTIDSRTKNDDDDTIDSRTKDEDDNTIDFGTKDKDDDDTIDFKTKLKVEALSVARQFYCFCSIMIFPVLAKVYDFIQTENDMSKYYPRLRLLTEVKPVSVEFYAYTHLSAFTGLVIGGVFLFVVGRKYAVIAANLSHLAVLIYAYLSGVDGDNKLSPFTLSMFNRCVENFSFVAYCIYVAEIANPTYRAFFLGFYGFNAAAFSKHVARAIEQERANQLIGNCAIVTAVSSLFAVFTPETPFWQALNGDEDEAERTLNWIRAGKLNPTEFDEMLEKADAINDDEGVSKQILSQTLVVGAILCLCMSMSNFDTCGILHVVLNDFYYPKEKSLSDDEKMKLFLLYQAAIANQRRGWLLGPAFFLALNFIWPRKVYYGVSYAGSILMFMVIRLKLGDSNVWATTISFCLIVRTAGVLPLQTVLPVEIYPVYVREIGVVTAGIFKFLVTYFYHLSPSPAHPDFTDRWLHITMSYTYLYLSFIMVPFMLTVMPETQNINSYRLDHLKLQRPVRRTREESDKEYYDEYL